jgi:methionyl-tRNA synthetase
MDCFVDDDTPSDRYVPRLSDRPAAAYTPSQIQEECMSELPPAAPAAPAAAPANATIQYDDFAKIQLKVATVVEAKLHPNADKLLVLQIDLGGERRQICAGIKAWYPPETLVGKQIVVVANLAPRPLRGEVSHGMLLAATDAATGNVIVLSPEKPVAAGSGVK